LFPVVWGLTACAPLLQGQSPPVPAWLGKRTALVVGTDTYAAPEWKRLGSPVRDAEALGRTLSSEFGFTTSVLRNPGKAELESAILRAKNEATGASDWTVIFIASHGFFDDDRNQGYLVTRDSRPRSAEGARGSYVSLAELLPMIEGFRNGHVLLILDACYAGTIDRDVATGTSRGAALESSERRILEQNAARRAQYVSRQFLTSGGKEYVPDGDPGAHSPFAGALLGSLRDAAAAGIPLTFDQLRGELAGAAIQPMPRHGSMRGHEPGGDFLFVPVSFLSGTSAAAPPRASSPQTERAEPPAVAPPTGPGPPRVSPPRPVRSASSLDEAVGLLGSADRGIDALDAACSAGETPACSLGAERALFARGANRNEAQARQLLQRGCRAGDAATCAELWVLDARAPGDRRRPETARSNLRTGCDARDAFACAALARLWIGEGTGGSPGELSDLLASACKAGTGAACGYGALAVPRAGDQLPRSAEELLETGCKALDLTSCAFLAQLYLDRDRTPAEVTLGVRLAEAACNRYHPVACNLLAREYEFGIGDDKPDFARVRQLAERSCATQSAEGCFLLGRAEDAGIGARRNQGAARASYQRACRLGLRADCTRPLSPATEIDWWRAVP
jgi:TPR repeat protein